MMLRRLLIMACLLMLGTGMCRAQEVGLLLGLRQQKGDTRKDSSVQATYRTLWIVAEGGHAAVDASRPVLLVPRKDGFWQVGVTRRARRQWIEDQVWAVPSGVSPRLQPLDPETIANTDGSSETMLLFVGPDYLATETSNGGYTKGAAHPFAGASLDVFSLDRLLPHAISPSAGYVFSKEGKNLYSVPIAAIYGDAGSKALHDGVQAYRKTLTAQKREALAGDGEDTDWTLIRRQGHWVTRGRLGYSAEVFRGTFADFDVAASPPETLTGPDRLSLPWTTIKKQVPEATDAMTAPDGQLLIVLTRTQIMAFPLHGASIGTQTLAVSLHSRESPVMIQWAVGGSNVRRWTEQMTDH
jgi:hypothetical protein